MRVEAIDLHNVGLHEALEKAEKNLIWCIDHQVEVIDFIHGKGLHSQRGLSVIKQELRRLLKNHAMISEAGYRIIPGESDLPIALSFDAGHTLVVRRGLEQQLLGGQRQQQKNRELFSAEGRQARKNAKGMQAAKHRRRPR